MSRLLFFLLLAGVTIVHPVLAFAGGGALDIAANGAATIQAIALATTALIAAVAPIIANRKQTSELAAHTEAQTNTIRQIVKEEVAPWRLEIERRIKALEERR